MKRSRFLTFLLLGIAASAALAGCGKADGAARIARVENGLQTPIVIQGDPTGNILDRMKHYGIPGVSVAVFDKDRIVWAKGYGVMDVDTKEPVTEKTLFVAGSISKPVAAMGALKLVEEGKIRLDDNINAVLTTWKLPENELTAEHPVTLRQLLSHSGGTTVHGFRGYAEGEPVPSITDILDGKGNSPAVRVDLEPGKQMRYSGGGVTVMQLALADVEKAPFPEILRTKVLEPIGMTSSSYEQTFTPERLKLAASGHDAQGKVIPGKRFAYPEMAAAGLWTTPTDLAKFAIEVRRSALGKSNKVLSKETAALMLKPQIAVGGKPGDGPWPVPRRARWRGLLRPRWAGRRLHRPACGRPRRRLRRGHHDQLRRTRGCAHRGDPPRAIAAEYGWKSFVQPALLAADRGNERPRKIPGTLPVPARTTSSRSRSGTRSSPGPQTEGSEFELVPVAAGEFVRRDAQVRYRVRQSGRGDVHLPRGKRSAARLADGTKGSA